MLRRVANNNQAILSNTFCDAECDASFFLLPSVMPLSGFRPDCACAWHDIRQGGGFFSSAVAQQAAGAQHGHFSFRGLNIWAELERRSAGLAPGAVAAKITSSTDD